MSDFITETGKLLGNLGGTIVNWLPSTKDVQTVVVKEVKTMTVIPASIFFRLAGLSGAIAVGIGAYGAHAFRDSGATEEQKRTFETASRYHFFHTLALLAVPLAGKPVLVGSLLVTGMTVFCGTCYISALTGNSSLNRFTPYGGMTLIAAWASMMF
ncbi:hypothetical protein LSH36_875g01063 [Paralvinella palmiformis]|uniref:Uncharacterized protein n=1 Tax=Paralvinella palmiformis TaxID=53620 RepID=A0AAD9IYW4_9ANNE|nr:hypothetical protein LSH36_875g01063 [Paralvinella palmiformis]